MPCDPLRFSPRPPIHTHHCVQHNTHKKTCHVPWNAHRECPHDAFRPQGATPPASSSPRHHTASLLLPPPPHLTAALLVCLCRPQPRTRRHSCLCRSNGGWCLPRALAVPRAPSTCVYCSHTVTAPPLPACFDTCHCTRQRRHCLTQAHSDCAAAPRLVRRAPAQPAPWLPCTVARRAHSEHAQ